MAFLKRIPKKNRGDVQLEVSCALHGALFSLETVQIQEMHDGKPPSRLYAEQILSSCPINYRPVNLGGLTPLFHHHAGPEKRLPENVFFAFFYPFNRVFLP